MFDKIRQVNQATIVENNHLDTAVMMARMMQKQLPARKRNNNEPRRRDQPVHLFPTPDTKVVLPVKRKRGRPSLPRFTPEAAAKRMPESC